MACSARLTRDLYQGDVVTWPTQLAIPFDRLAAHRPTPAETQAAASIVAAYLGDADRAVAYLVNAAATNCLAGVNMAAGHALRLLLAVLHAQWVEPLPEEGRT